MRFLSCTIAFTICTTAADGANLYATAGGTLALPGLTSYAALSAFNTDRRFRSDGGGSVLDLSACSTVSGGTSYTQELWVQAWSGGHVLLGGVPDHRDSVLGPDEREANDCMMICVSRARTDRLVLDL